MIIDAHAHLGYDYVFDVPVSEEELVQAYDKFKVDHAIVQPLLARPYVEDTKKAHDEVYDLCNKSKRRFFGMASINPHFSPEDYDKELNRCIKELGFVGVKITPIGHSAGPATKDCMHVYEIAQSLDIPVMIHTGSGIPFADPIQIIDGIRAFPKVTFVVSHCGTDMFFKQALVLAKDYNNVYLEPSWINILNIMGALKTVGAEKIMFSSDLPWNIPVELTKYQHAARNAKELERMLFGTAAEVYRLNI